RMDLRLAGAGRPARCPRCRALADPDRSRPTATDGSIDARTSMKRARSEAVLAAPDLTPGEKLVAIRIALHRNDETLRCFPGEEALVRGTALKDRTVRGGVATSGRANGRPTGRFLAGLLAAH